MYEHWNKERHKWWYEHTLEEATRAGFSMEELESPYLDKLSHQTKSPRIYRMVKLAYYLGQLRGIRKIDEGCTPVVLD